MTCRRTSMVLFAAALIAVTSQDKVNPDIVYKYTDAYELIWKDAGSGGDMDGAMWRARNYQSEFCSLGDVTTGSWSSPASKAVLVSERKKGALRHPTSFSWVWSDWGSGADYDVAIYKMNAPFGYTCLGGVAVNSHYTKPDSKKYCCVKNEYVVQADMVLSWNDKGTDAEYDVSLWTVIRAGGDALGIDAGNFIGISGYSMPKSSAAYLLKADGRKVRDIWSLPPGEDKPLNLYEVGELKMIWNDAGSGANSHVSIWRTESRNGYYPLGDIAVGTRSKPRIGFLLRSTDVNDDSILAPVSYSRIWNDAGSGADKDVQLWRVNCPGGYVCLGNVATSGSYPKIGDVYCVKSSYTSYGSSSNWKKVWNDGGSGADRDVTIYEARATSSKHQSVRGFGAVASYSLPRHSPYLLNKKFVNYWAEKPIEKIIMYNVQYNLRNEKQQSDPVKMSPTIVENCSDREQKVRRKITYKVAQSSSFTFSQAIQLGISVKITAGSPLIGIAQETTVSASTTSTFTSGETTTKSHEDTIQAEVNLAAHSKLVATITGKEYKADVPYTASIKKIYYDGSQAYATISGVYKGVAVSEIKVSYGKSEYFKPKNCPPNDFGDQEITKVTEIEDILKDILNGP